jgi:pimeloyl-ACP methyl ester carboxylesterase
MRSAWTVSASSGSPYGGFWALSLALAAPERVSRLVVVNAVGGPSTPEERATLRARVQDDPDAPEPTVDEQIELTVRAILADPSRAPASLRDDLRWQMERADPAQRGVGLDAVERMSDERFDRIACPTLVAWGEADSLLPPAMGRRLAAAIPGARYVGLPGCGHDCQIECPDALVAAVAPFLDQTA